MKFCLSQPGSADREFDTITEFINALTDLAETYEENGEEWFEVHIVND